MLSYNFKKIGSQNVLERLSYWKDKKKITQVWQAERDTVREQLTGFFFPIFYLLIAMNLV